ncbi:hypothetical protein FDECE_1136 [Fusarium decemcellulare]|nr:hypothetical protein FDECE_1136 [Fusarium decemcellulare]
MKFSLVTISALAASLTSAYKISGDGVRCRTGPGTSYDIVRSFSKGADVTITCQTTGTSVNGHNIWDKISLGCYVSDYYVKTGSSGFVTKKCGSSGGSCGAPKSNQAAVNLIASFEGFRARPYKDPTGNPTVGYGHLCKNSKCTDVKYSIPLSQANGKKLLADDMAKFEKCITAMLNSKVTLNKNQYGALISWSFNNGCGNAKSSTLVKRLNKGESPKKVIPQELPKWVYASGKKLPGLVRRRKAEVALAQKATTDKALPKKC